MVLVRLAKGNLHRTPSILDGKGDLEDILFDNARDKVPRRGHQHGTKGKPTLSAPTLMDRDIDLHSMDSYARNLGVFRKDGCILLHD